MPEDEGLLSLALVASLDAFGVGERIQCALWVGDGCNRIGVGVFKMYFFLKRLEAFPIFGLGGVHDVLGRYKQYDVKCAMTNISSKPHILPSLISIDDRNDSEK